MLLFVGYKCKLFSDYLYIVYRISNQYHYFMNKFLSFFIFILFICACREETPIITEPMIPVCNLDVLVYKCPIFQCANGVQVLLDAQKVQLFRTVEDAIDGIDELASVWTDENGNARFINVECGAVYVKVKHEINGTYISYQNLSLASTISYHEVAFVANSYYDNDDNAGLRQNHISLEFPNVGQSSTYRYFENNNHVSFTPLEYTSVFLNVRITGQIDEHSFIVEEEIDSLYGSLSWPTGGTETLLRNVWTIRNDEVYISPVQGDYFQSFLWGLNEWYVTDEKDGYSFSLVRPNEEELDMDADNITALEEFWKTKAIKDYNLFGKAYSDLIGDKINYTGFDGPIKLRVYNKQDGLVRNLDFLSGMSLSTKGFDLVLE